MQSLIVFGVIASLGLGVSAAPQAQTTPAPKIKPRELARRAALPASSGSSKLAAVSTIAAGKAFDGGMVMFDRGVSCTGQAEGGDSDAVFILEEGASLSNVIIGPNQIEGVHCNGGCTLSNVWWSAVCEDAFTIKKQADGSTTTIKGGGAFGAEDKVLQHNGGGTLSVSDFTVSDFGKLYRSCGNCKTQSARHVIMNGVTASEGKIIAGINSNFGDTATLNGISATGVDDVCVRFEGNDTGAEPKEIGSGADGKNCIIDGASSGGSGGSSAGGATSTKKATSAAAGTKTTAASSTKAPKASSTKSKKDPQTTEITS